MSPSESETKKVNALLARLDPGRDIRRNEVAVITGPDFAGSEKGYREDLAKFLLDIEDLDKHALALFNHHITTRARLYANSLGLLKTYSLPNKDGKDDKDFRPIPVSWVHESPNVWAFVDGTSEEAVRARNKHYPHHPKVLFKATWMLANGAKFNAQRVVKEVDYDSNSTTSDSKIMTPDTSPSKPSTTGTRKSPGSMLCSEKDWMEKAVKLFNIGGKSVPVSACPPKVNIEKAKTFKTNTPLLEVLGNTELGEKIVNDLSYQSLSRLSQTCTGALIAVSSYTHRWDMSAPWFNYCEMSQDEFQSFVDSRVTKVRSAAKNAGLDPEEEVKKMTHPIRTRPVGLVLVSPSRLPLDMDTDHKYNRMPANFYSRHLRSTAMFLRAGHQVGRYVENLNLQRMPFLDIMLLRAMLPSFPNLKRLAVLQCPQIGFFDTTCLLTFVNDYQIKFKHDLKLDFYPRFHQGPRYKHRAGCFGLPWADTGIRLNTAMACALGYRVIPQILACGQRQMLDVDSSFIAWLEKLPLPDFFVPRIITLFLSRFDAPEGKMSTNEFLRFAFSLARAVFGNEGRIDSDDGCTWEDVNKLSGPLECMKCDKIMPNYLFTMSRICDGCELKGDVNYERDHYKEEKLRITDALVKDTTKAERKYVEDIDELAHFDNNEWLNCLEHHFDTYRKALLLADRLDERRLEDLSKGINVEHEEVQYANPFRKRPGMGASTSYQRIHARYRKPTSWDMLLDTWSRVHGTREVVKIQDILLRQWRDERKLPQPQWLQVLNKARNEAAEARRNPAAQGYPLSMWLLDDGTGQKREYQPPVEKTRPSMVWAAELATGRYW